MAVEPTGHPIATIAQLLDLTERRVQQLSVEGVIPKASHGRYNIPLAVRGYIKYLRERAVQGDPKGADEIGASRAALLKARARMATLEADQFEMQLLRRVDVEKAWGAVIAAIRTRLLAIPHTSAQAVTFLTTPQQVSAHLTNAVIEALDDISSIPVYGDPGREPEARSDSALDAEGGQATADADSVAVGRSAADPKSGDIRGAGAVEH